MSSNLSAPQNVILAPVVSERAYDQLGMKKYRFRVATSANKIQIKAAIEQMFPDAKVSSVNTSMVRGKTRRRGRHIAQDPSWKKATITLREGVIDLFEQV